MKRTILSGILVFTLLLCVPTAEAALQILACEPEWGAMAQEIGGEAVEVKIASTGRQDPHRIQARPGLIAQARNADLLFCTGAELETGWLPLVLRQSANARIQPGTPGYLEAASLISLKEVPQHLDRAEGDIHASGNPHVQTDPRHFPPIAKALAERLVALDPTRTDVYRSRLDRFLAQWQQALSRWESRGAPLKGIPVAVQHKSWVYLLDWLGLQDVVTLEPKPGVPPSSGHLSEVLATIKQHPVKMTLRAAHEDGRPSQWLEEQAGVPAVTLPFTVGGNERAKDLFTLFDDTLDRLLKGARL